MNIDRGVKRFITGRATITVKFPVDWSDRELVRCTACPYLSSNSRICKLTGEPVYFPERTIGYDCPLEFEEDIANG